MVRTAGQGPPLLLLHGVPTSGLLFRDCVEPLVAAGFSLIMPDLPGYGDSEGIEPALRVQDHLDWVEEVLDHLGLDRVHVAGLDLGGLLAAGLCLRGRAEHVALTSTAIGPGWLPAKLTALPGPHLFFYKFYGGRRWLQQGVHPSRAEALLALHSPRLESDPGFVERMQDTALAFSFGEWLRWPRELAATPNPKRLIWGRDDRFFPPWMAKRIAGNLDCGVDWIDGGRHHLPFGHPETWAEALVGFLPSVSSGNA